MGLSSLTVCNWIVTKESPESAGSLDAIGITDSWKLWGSRLILAAFAPIIGVASSIPNMIAKIPRACALFIQEDLHPVCESRIKRHSGHCDVCFGHVG